MRRLGIYLHIPFCVKKCAYCDFLSFPPQTGDMDSYCAALSAEMALYQKRMSGYLVDSIFVGGGTPTLLSGRQIAALLCACRENFSVDAQAEITIEANPGSIDGEKADFCARSGVNRVSFGLQATQDRLLAVLGRLHSGADFEAGVRCFQRAGIHNISGDLMYGLPGQTAEDFVEAIDFVGFCGAQHISAYALTIEEGTPLYAAVSSGDVSLPDEEGEIEQICAGRAALERAGYLRYEVSNYARRGHTCRHNLKYWTGDEYLGLGMGAHSFLREGAVTRFENHCGLQDYIRRIAAEQFPVAQARLVDEKEQMFEAVMLGLRLTEGIDLRGFYGRYGVDLLERYAGALDKNRRLGLLRVAGGRVCLTQRGMDIMNTVLLDFMDVPA
ncbi:MAG: radical SAM family heme chaperone HemW [Christensenellales bacterium]|jgi:oxygen-independent coproporphyrinogen-3 oxidase